MSDKESRFGLDKMSQPRRVLKADNVVEDFDVEKVRRFYESIAYGLDARFVNIGTVVDKLVQGLPAVIDVPSLTKLMAEVPAYLSQAHFDYGKLAARVVMSTIRKHTPSTFSLCVEALANHVCAETRKQAPLVSSDFA